ncbi:hypothetical protein BDP55DRAFT_638453 [Colletotrichum godetiae]|uniref:F-box domain-containing protein n=1 Tax=Colletotrichum godetiae TaxID=1209918 RepID=A0AAJ0A9Y2_9PEZI|nr:uncharacterized protein BDP55DRAFT_638453 [Colletotrichum godetiae]KAK1657727.1 hypothetical protein BDP55DRAFT_638453 [Colletotrichum godetiae]
MNKLPQELVLHISSHLSIPDLCRFRLVNRSLADTTYPGISKHVSLLNISSSAEDFILHFTDRRKSSCTKSLTVYHGEWPVCSRKEWQVHPLSLYEIHPRAFLDAAIDDVYERYLHFTSLQWDRPNLKDPSAFYELLSTLPQVKSLTLSPLRLSSRRCWSINKRIGRLRSNMWISPSFNDSMAPLIGAFLSVSERFPRIKELIVKGRLNPQDVSLTADTCVIRLEIVSLVSVGARSEAFLALIHRFPKLEHLSVRLETANSIHVPTSVHGIQIQSLRSLFLGNLWISETWLTRIIDQNSCMGTVGLTDITLTEGTWQSFFTRLRNNSRLLNFTCNGVLDGTSLDCPALVMEDDKRYLLYRFLNYEQSRWPFKVFKFRESIYV